MSAPQVQQCPIGCVRVAIPQYGLEQTCRIRWSGGCIPSCRKRGSPDELLVSLPARHDKCKLTQIQTLSAQFSWRYDVVWLKLSIRNMKDKGIVVDHLFYRGKCKDDRRNGILLVTPQLTSVIRSLFVHRTCNIIPLNQTKPAPVNTTVSQYAEIMTTEATVRKFFASSAFAVVGASSNPAKFGHRGMSSLTP